MVSVKLRSENTSSGKANGRDLALLGAIVGAVLAFWGAVTLGLFANVVLIGELIVITITLIGAGLGLYIGKKLERLFDLIDRAIQNAADKASKRPQCGGKW